MSVIPADNKMLCPETKKRVPVKKHKLTKRNSG